MAENFPGAKPLAAPSLATDNPIPPLPNNLTAGEFLLSLINKGPQSQPNPPPAFPGAGNVSFLPPGFLGYPAASPIPRSAWPDNRIPAASESGIPPPGFYGHGPLPQRPPPGFPPQLGFLDPKNPPPPQSPHLIFGSFVTPIVSQPHSSDFIQRNGAQPLRNLNSDNLSFVLEEKLKIRDPGNPNSISIANKIEEHVSTSEEVEVEESTEFSTIKSTSTSRNKDYRSDFSRGHHVSGQRVRYRRREIRCRRDITHFNSKLMQIYESLTPPEDEKLKQIDLLQRLEKLVIQEWPNAGIHLYGSCANSFGTSNSDIDVCLQIPDLEKEKSEVLLRLAEILESNNLEDVQALTRARVPIVKLRDPMTSISCDICINNMLAVVNTKLLRDYSQIDSRLRQLVFIVKHWAKARGVNDTYQGTLSSYAYALMCIHFLQIHRPPILPCLQEMQPTYAMKVDGVECTFFDQVNEFRNFGSKNKEGISELLWGFFNYWAYHHDYMNDVISVRTGGIIRKHSKDWTRRIGNDRHLICIEDPFELSHDLGRVVDKFTIKILREEFERAADIMQFDPHPITRLFEPYVRPALDQS